MLAAGAAVVCAVECCYREAELRRRLDEVQLLHDSYVGADVAFGGRQLEVLQDGLRALGEDVDDLIVQTERSGNYGGGFGELLDRRMLRDRWIAVRRGMQHPLHVGPA